MSNKQKITDYTYQAITYLAAFIAVGTLSLIFMFVFSNGYKLLNIGLIVNDYHATFYNGALEDNFEFSTTTRPSSLNVDTYYSEKWGLGLKDDIDREGNSIIIVEYIASDSPLLSMYDKNNEEYMESIVFKEGQLVSKISYFDKSTSLTRTGAEVMILDLDSSESIRELVYSSLGGGIRGSIITTFYLIAITIAIALPIGIFTAIYLNEFAHKSKITSILRSLIEVLTGVPSIIFGLMGLAVFVPLTIKLTQAESANIISGSLTLAVILLPVIIRATEESLKIVPDTLRESSLALGANQTQTTFKVVLPSAIPGILTATLLAIGRVIGESAALIFAIGTAVKDDISIFGKSTSLSVHIWSMMKDEPANIELASTIAIVILMIVLVLNIIIKLISKRFIRELG
jgi:phosphate transport system permease protein